MRKLLFLALLLLTAAGARAQSGFTIASGFVLDPNGVPYSQCKGNAAYVPSPTATTIPTINGSTFQTDVPINSCDSFGLLTIMLVDNNLVSDGHTGAQTGQWNFAISSQDGKTSFQCKITITGTTQTITSSLQSCAPVLPAGGGGGGAFVVKTVPCASNMSFPIAGASPNTANTAFSVSLNCNVASSAIVGNPFVTTGTQVEFVITQDNVGGHTFAWPANFLNPPTVQAGANQYTSVYYWFNGTNWVPSTYPTGTGGANYQTVQQNSVNVTQQPKLNFVLPLTVTNNAGNASTDITCAIMTSAGLGHASGCVPDPGATINNNPLCDNGTFSPVCKGNASLISPITTNQSWTGINSYYNAASTVPVDITGYGSGIYAVFSSTTCSITSGSGTMTLGAASNFQNGEYASCNHAGAAAVVATPTITSVTPMSHGGGFYALSGPTASTTYNYEVVNVGLNGDVSAASAVGTTTTGQATLGLYGVVATSCSRSGNVSTVNTSSNPNVVVGQKIWIYGCSDTTFNGEWRVSASTSGSVSWTSNWDTTQGAGTTATITGQAPNGFNVWSWAFNRVAVSHDANTIYHLLYGPNCPGTCNRIARSTLDFIDDYGATMEGSQTWDSWTPSTAPASALAQRLTFKITSGGGTTTLSVTPVAGTTATTQTVVSDAGPAISNACTTATQSFSQASPVVIPNNNINYQVNSYVNNPNCRLTLYGTTLQVNAPMNLYEIDGIGSGGNAYNFGFARQPAVSGYGYPMLYSSGVPVRLEHVAVFNSSNNGGLSFFAVNPIEGYFNDTWWGSAAGGTSDYLSLSMIFQATGTGATAFNNSWMGGTTFASSGVATAKFTGNRPYPTVAFTNDAATGTTAPGGIYLDGPAWFVNSGGISSSNQSGAGCIGSNTASFKHFWSQDATLPVLEFAGVCGGLAAEVLLQDAYPADFATPIFSNLEGLTGMVQMINMSGPAGAVSIMTGIPTTVYATNSVSSRLGDAQIISMESNNGVAVGNYFGNIRVGINNYAFTDSQVTAAPTCAVVSTTPFTPAGTYTYNVHAVYLDNGYDGGSVTSVSCTSDGAHQIQVTANAVPGAIGYLFYANAFGFTGSGFSCGSPLTGGLTIAHVTNCGISYFNVATGGPTGFGGQGLHANKILLGNVTSMPAPVATAFQLVNLNNWPTFNINGVATNYAMAGFTGAITSGGNVCASGTLGALTTVGCTGGGGTPANPNLSIQVNNSGVFGAVAQPTAPSGVPQFDISIPNLSGATQNLFALAGIPGRISASCSETIIATDRTQYVEDDCVGGAAVSLPQAGVINFTNNFMFQYHNGGTGTAILTPAPPSLINGGASFSVNVGASCTVKSTDNLNYVATCAEPQLFPGAGVSFARTPVGTTISASGGGTGGGGPILATSFSQQVPKGPMGFSSSTTVTVANSTSATSLIGSPRGQQLIPANTMMVLGPGVKIYEWNANGVVSTLGAAPGNISVVVVVGGVAIDTVTLASANVPTSLSGAQWTFDYKATVIGLTAMQGGGCLEIINSSNQTIKACSSQTSAPGLSFITDQIPDLKWTWQTASASNSVTSNQVSGIPLQQY